MDRVMENLREILLGGQSFSWREEGSGVFSAVLNGRVYRISSIEECRNDPFLYDYFDMSYDYDKAKKDIAALDPLLKEATEKVGTLRLLKQDPFVTLISFILSQNNNIKRIKGLYDRLSQKYGKEVEEGYYSFPTADELKDVSQEDFRALGMGFRAPFLVDAVKKAGILDEVWNLGFDDAAKLLMTIKGVGPKVASCILIFAYQRKDGFPMDVWMKRVMAKYYPGKDKSYFAPYEALSQQYLFSWIREIEG